MSIGGGCSILKGISGAPVAASVDMVGEKDDAEVNEQLLGLPSVFMSPNRDLLEPFLRSMTSLYFSPSTSTAASLKSVTAAGADAGSGATNASLSTSSITFSELAL
jgi:hypothetical protein